MHRPPLLALVSLVIACLGACCRSGPARQDAVPRAAVAVPAPIGPCIDRREVQFLTPALADDGVVTVKAKSSLSIVAPQVRGVVRTALPGGSGPIASYVETGEVDAAPTPACTYTLVTAEGACLLAPTGHHRATRRGQEIDGHVWSLDAWKVEHELGSPACATLFARVAAMSTEGLYPLPRVVIATGAHPAMRLVLFAPEVFVGPERDTDRTGGDLGPVMAIWPTAELRRYRRGRFQANPSIALTDTGWTVTRELTWFGSRDDEGRWSSRLRDRKGRVLIETDSIRSVVRSGDTLYTIDPATGIADPVR